MQTQLYRLKDDGAAGGDGGREVGWVSAMHPRLRLLQYILWPEIAEGETHSSYVAWVYMLVIY